MTTWQVEGWDGEELAIAWATPARTADEAIELVRKWVGYWGTGLAWRAEPVSERERVTG